MTDGPAGDLEAVIATVIADLEDVVRAPTAAGSEWSTRGAVFAAIDGKRGEFRLAPPVVAAALRTPDTGTSTRGADWVAFAPAELDRHAIDRASAWVASAWRRARAGN
jgi:hypothetical protein